MIYYLIIEGRLASQLFTDFFSHTPRERSKNPALASLSFEMARPTDVVPATNQYPLLLCAVINAYFSGIPNFSRLRNLVFGFFHCFQMYMRILLRSQPFHSAIVFFIDAKA